MARINIFIYHIKKRILFLSFSHLASYSQSTILIIYLQNRKSETYAVWFCLLLLKVELIWGLEEENAKYESPVAP